MRSSRSAMILILALALAAPLAADGRRHAMGAPPSAMMPVDALGIGPMTGAAVSGTVAAVEGTVIRLNAGGAAAIRIEAASAKIVGAKQEGLLALADVTAGSRITAFINTTASVVPGAPLPAQLIALETQPDLVVAGTIESIDLPGSKLTVLGIPIAVDAKTSFGTAFPTFAAVKGLADLVVGQVVTVNVTFAGPALLATRVFVTAPSSSGTAMLRGTVKSISAASWVITDGQGKDVTILVDDQTKIGGNPKVGDLVQVMARVDSASNYLALAIVKLDAGGPSKELELRGYVKSIAADRWSIGGPPGSMMPEMLVMITSTTVIYPNPKVGDRVVVTGRRDANGILTAATIARDE